MNTATATRHLSRDLFMPEVPCDASERAVMPRGDSYVPASATPPEHRLMIAMVRDAIRCIEKYRRACDAHGRRCFDREVEWILSDDTDRLYAFARICETLDLEPDAVRRSLGFVVERRNVSPTRAAVWNASFVLDIDYRTTTIEEPRRARRPISHVAPAQRSLPC